MPFTLAHLKECATTCGAELLVLSPNGKLPKSLRGKSSKELWLCVKANTNKKLIYVLASHFDKVYTFIEKEDK
jgi:hypothetical protein